MAKGQSHPDLFRLLHEAALRDDKLAEVAFAYEHVASDKRVKLLPTAQQAELFVHAAVFFGDFFGDSDGAVGHAERVLSIAPGQPEAFALLERLLSGKGDPKLLVKLYVDASNAERERERQVELLQRAARVVEATADAHDAAMTSTSGSCASIRRRATSATPWKRASALPVVRATPPSCSRQSLLREPAPSERRSCSDPYPPDGAVREGAGGAAARYAARGGAAGRYRPDDAQALATAEALLEHRAVAARAAAALSDAYEKLGRLPEAAAMLTRELKIVRGPRRMEVQRRLAVLRQDVLGDPSGALELMGPVLSADVGDDDLRGRYVQLSFDLDQPQQAARLLSRALQTSKDPAIRARVGADIGRVFLKAGDVRRAQAALQQVVEEGHDAVAVLAAARQLAELHAQAGDTKGLLGALELVVLHEPDAETRNAAARRLARLCETENADPARAVVAWRALADSPWADEALGKLEAITTPPATRTG